MAKINLTLENHYNYSNSSYFLSILNFSMELPLHVIYKFKKFLVRYKEVLQKIPEYVTLSNYIDDNIRSRYNEDTPTHCMENIRANPDIDKLLDMKFEVEVRGIPIDCIGDYHFDNFIDFITNIVEDEKLD